METFDNGSVKGLWRNSVRNHALWSELQSKRLANLPLAHAWREAAIADGWRAEPTYQSEPIEHAAKLHREGFFAQILTRPIPGKNGELSCPDVHVWGPDGAVVNATPVYNWEALQRACRVCDQCGKTDVDTQRYAFADRCCAECGPKYMASLPPNWAD